MWYSVITGGEDFAVDGDHGVSLRESTSGLVNDAIVESFRLKKTTEDTIQFM